MAGVIVWMELGKGENMTTTDKCQADADTGAGASSREGAHQTDIDILCKQARGAVSELEMAADALEKMRARTHAEDCRLRANALHEAEIKVSSRRQIEEARSADDALQQLRASQ